MSLTDLRSVILKCVEHFTEEVISAVILRMVLS